MGKTFHNGERREFKRNRGSRKTREFDNFFGIESDAADPSYEMMDESEQDRREYFRLKSEE